MDFHAIFGATLANVSTGVHLLHQGSGSGGPSSLLHDLTGVVSTVVSGILHLDGSIAGSIGGSFGSLAGEGADALLQAIASWVTTGAVWLLDEVGQVLSSTTSVDLGSSWFGARLSLMSELAGSVMLPMLFVATIQAVYRQSAAALLRIFLVNLPAALLLTGVAVELVRVSMAITDTMSSQFLAAGGVDTRQLLAPISTFLASAPPGVPQFAMFIGAVMVAGCAFILWLELVVRSAAIAAAALFLPIVLAALVWPAISHWARRLADTLASLVLSKLVIAAVISLAAGALNGGLTGPGSAGTKFGDLVVGIALLLLAIFTPFVLLRLIPMFEAGAVSHLEGTRNRLAPPIVQSGVRSGVGHVMDRMNKAKPELPEAGETSQRMSPGGGSSGAQDLVGNTGAPSEDKVADEQNKMAPIGSTLTGGTSGGTAAGAAATGGGGSAGASATGASAAGAGATGGASLAVSGAAKVGGAAMSGAADVAKGAASATSEEGPKKGAARDE